MAAAVAMAEALLRFRRALDRSGRPARLVPGVAFATLDTFEARIRQLLFPARTSGLQRFWGPWPWGLLALLVWQAEAVHRSLEAVLRLLHR